MWPAQPKLHSIHGFILAWDFACTLCGDWSSGWGQLWSVPLSETTWQISAIASTSWWKPTCPGPMAELSLLELQCFLKKRWLPDGAPGMMVPAPCTTHYCCWYIPSYWVSQAWEKKYFKIAKRSLMCPCCRYHLFPYWMAFPKWPPLGQAVNQHPSLRESETTFSSPSTTISDCKKAKRSIQIRSLIAFFPLGHPLI